MVDDLNHPKPLLMAMDYGYKGRLTQPKRLPLDPKLMSEPTISLFRIKFGFTCISRKINTAKIENDILLINYKL